MQKHIIDEKTGIPYSLVGDYYLPWGDLPDDEPEQSPIGIWGQRRKCYLKEHHRVLYYNLLTSGKLNAHLADVDEQAEEMYSWLAKQLAEKENVTERLKAHNQIEWVQRINVVRETAKEIVNNDLIYT